MLHQLHSHPQFTHRFFVCFADKRPFASICHAESHVVIPILATLSNCQAGLDAVTPCSELDLQKAQFRAAQFETNSSSIKVHQGPVWQQCNVSVIQHKEWSKVHEWTKPQPGLQLFKPIRLRYQKAELFTRSSLQDQLCLGLCRPAVMELQDIASRNIFQHVATGFPTWQDSGVVIPCWGRSLYHSAGSVWILFLTDFILFKIMFIFFLICLWCFFLWGGNSCCLLCPEQDFVWLKPQHVLCIQSTCSFRSAKSMKSIEKH